MVDNQKTAIQEMEETEKRRKAEELEQAVKLVNEAIEKERKRLNDAASGIDQEPVMIEGETTAGFFCQLMVDPKDVAKIILRYDYPTCRVLGEEAPDEMWEELGRHFGLSVVSSFDL